MQFANFVNILEYRQRLFMNGFKLMVDGFLLNVWKTTSCSELPVIFSPGFNSWSGNNHSYCEVEIELSYEKLNPKHLFRLA